MKQRIFIILSGVVVIMIGVAYLLMQRGPEWTTKSPEALAELNAAWSASQKLYMQEARKHLKKALSLDPDFVMAKLRLAEQGRFETPEESKKLIEELRKVDLKKLKPREAFLVKRMLMLQDGKWEEARAALDAYFKEHPDDPQILYMKAMDDWKTGNLGPAEKLYSQLLEIRPNWVIAYNQMGYISMIQGRLSKAEEYFSEYRFIAPDQANPHDSLGELYALIGKWDEAEASFRKALEVKPEFTVSMLHMAILEGLRGNWDEAEKWVEKVESMAGSGDEYTHSIRCRLKFWKLAREQNWEAILEEARGDCNPEKSPMLESGMWLHEAACRLGRWDITEGVEAELKSRLESQKQTRNDALDIYQAALDHLMGIRLSAQGKMGEAAVALEKSDHYLTYINMDVGIFKLSNRLSLAGVLRAEGREKEAQDWVDKVRKVNPNFTKIWGQWTGRVWEQGSGR